MQRVTSPSKQTGKVTYRDIEGEREADLIRQFQAGDRNAGGILLRAHAGMIMQMAKRYLNKRHDLELSDLVAEAQIGFLESVRRFDPSLGFRLVTYAQHRTRQGARRAVQETGTTIRVPVNQQDRGLDRDDSYAIAARNALSPSRLDAPIGDGEAVLCDLLSSGEDIETTIADLEDVGFKTGIANSILAAMPAREVDILRRRAAEETLEDIAASYGLSRERIRQIEASAIVAAQKAAKRLAQNPSTPVPEHIKPGRVEEGQRLRHARRKPAQGPLRRRQGAESGKLSKAERLAIASAVAGQVRQQALRPRRVVLVDKEGNPKGETTSVEIAKSLLARSKIELSVDRPKFVNCETCSRPVEVKGNAPRRFCRWQEGMKCKCGAPVRPDHRKCAYTSQCHRCAAPRPTVRATPKPRKPQVRRRKNVSGEVPCKTCGRAVKVLRKDHRLPTVCRLDAPKCKVCGVPVPKQNTCAFNRRCPKCGRDSAVLKTRKYTDLQLADALKNAGTIRGAAKLLMVSTTPLKKLARRLGLVPTPVHAA